MKSTGEKTAVLGCGKGRILGQFGKVSMVAKDLARKKFAAGGAGQPWWPGNPPGSRRNPPRKNPGKAPAGLDLLRLFFGVGDNEIQEF